MANLPAGITITSFKERHKKAFAAQATWQSLLSDAYAFFLPQQATWRFQNLSPGQARDYRILDGLPEDAMEEASNVAKAAITPDWRTWAKLKPGFELPEEVRESTDVLEQLEDITDILFSHIQQSNFNIQMSTAYGDWLIGTAAIETRENTDPDESILSYHALNQQFVAYEEGPFQNVESEFKFREVPARNVEATYPGGDFSQETRDKMKDKPTAEVKFCEGYVKTKEGYFIIVMEDETEQVVWSEPQGKHNPIAVFRYKVSAGEIRGRGPGVKALPDSKTLNKIQEFALQKAALELSGMYTSVDDGIFNANTVTISPGTIIPVGSNGNQNPSLQRLDTGADLQLSLFELERISNSIRKAFFNDLRDPNGPVRSATEVFMNSQKLSSRIGGAFGRIQTEGLVPILNRSLEILQRRGIVPNLSINGREITVQFISPLAQAQSQEELIAVQTAIEMSMQTSGPEITALVYDLEKTSEFIGKKTGMDAGLIRTEEAREQKKKELAELAQMAAEAQQEQPQQGATQVA